MIANRSASKAIPGELQIPQHPLLRLVFKTNISLDHKPECALPWSKAKLCFWGGKALGSIKWCSCDVRSVPIEKYLCPQ